MQISSSTRPKTLLICNPEAGRQRWRRRRQVEAAARELERAGLSVEILYTAQPGEGAVAALHAIATGAQLIVACGGDGTINDVLGGMAQSQVPLAILPGGTANVLARELGLPLDIPAAARLIPRCMPRRIALGNAGERYFILMAGVGFDASVVRGVNARWKKLFGMATYVVEALRQLAAGPLHPFVLTSGQQERRATFACISRAQFYGPVRLIREADLLSDCFYVYSFSSSNPLRYFSYAAALLTTLHGRLPDFTGFSSKEIRCEQLPANGTGNVNGNKTFLQVDGEFAGELPCTIRIVPDALTLLVPPGWGRQHKGWPRKTPSE